MEALRVYLNKSQEKVVVDFLKSLKIPFDKGEELPQHVLEGINKGQEDILSGRTITFEEFQARSR